MATNGDDPLSSDGLSAPRALSVPRTVGGFPAELAWRGGPSLETSESQSGAGLSAYGHGFRRRWLSAILLGVAVAGAAAPAVWFTYRPQYTATAMFKIAANQQTILFPTADRTTTTFDVYKNTQQQYVKSRFVLIAALRKPETANLKALQDDPDPVSWLARNLRVDFPGNAELMQISLKANDPQEAAALVNAVVDAYTKEIVEVELGERRRRLDDLERIRSEKETELRAKQSDLKGLVRQVGSGETAALTMQQQIALQTFAALRAELSTTKFKSMRMEWDLASKEAAAKASDKTEVTDVEIEARLQADPIALSLLRDNAELRRRRDGTKSVFAPGGGSEHLRKYEEPQKSNDSLLAARRSELREELKLRKKQIVQAEVQQLKAEIAAAKAQEKQLVEEAQKAEKEAKSVGSSSIDVEMIRTEIALIQGTMQTAADEREKLLIEVRSNPRISLYDKAAVPTAPDSDRQLQYTVLAGLAGFFLPFAGIIWLDVRSRRISSSAQVLSSTGLDVIGAVPLLPGSGAGRAILGSRRQQRFREQMHESVDGIAARLLHLAERDQTRIVLVSSAVSGEGKTTLATQLALSLARTGHRTLLLDFDLRQPSIDRVFDVPLEPGLVGALRKEADLREAIQESDVENLWVLPAGRGDRRLLASLANGAVGALFARLREEFDFVIVDASPILPVADSRFLCKQVDAVVLSVLRDVSSVPNILAACEVLAGFGVRPIGAVVTGSSGDLHFRSPGYVSSG